MGLEERKTAQWGLAWVANGISSAAIIMFNTLLMKKYLLMAPALVSAAQMLFTAACLALLDFFGVWEGNNETKEKQGIPNKHLVAFTLIGCFSLTTANYTLAWNGLGMYQTFKLGLLPVIFGMELLLSLRRNQLPVAFALAVVLSGLAVCMYQDAIIKLPGLLMALVFCLSTGAQQVLCGRLQQMYKMAPHQLLLKASILQGGVLLFCGPLIDKALTGSWAVEWEINVPGLEMLLASCGAAVVVNLTQYVILADFSASSYQVFGTLTKTIVVQVAGAVLLNEHHWMSSTGYSGIALGLFGLVLYGAFSLHQQPPAAQVKSPFLNSKPQGQP